MADSVTPLVLLHAFPLDRRLWDSVVPLLVKQGYEPIVPDLRGFGANTHLLPDVPSLDVLADDIAELIDQAGGNAVVAGVSLGGYVAMNLARRYPHLVAGLGLIDTKAGADGEAAVQGRLAFADRVELEGSGWVADAMIPNLISDHTIATQPAVEAAVREQIADCPPATIAWIQRAMAARPDSFPVLQDLAAPVLVVVGSEDLLSPPAEALAMAEVAQRATLIEIPQVGHLTPMESPELVTTALIDWLTEVVGEADPE